MTGMVYIKVCDDSLKLYQTEFKSSYQSSPLIRFKCLNQTKNYGYLCSKTNHIIILFNLYFTLRMAIIFVLQIKRIRSLCAVVLTCKDCYKKDRLWSEYDILKVLIASFCLEYKE